MCLELCVKKLPVFILKMITVRLRIKQAAKIPRPFLLGFFRINRLPLRSTGLILPYQASCCWPFPHIYKRCFPARLKPDLSKKNIGQYANGLQYIPQKHRRRSGWSIGSAFIPKHKKPLSVQLRALRFLPIRLLPVLLFRI